MGKSSRQERAVFDVLWQLAGAARLEAVTAADTRYALRAMRLESVVRVGRWEPYQWKHYA